MSLSKCSKAFGVPVFEAIHSAPWRPFFIEVQAEIFQQIDRVHLCGTLSAVGIFMFVGGPAPAYLPRAIQGFDSLFLRSNCSDYDERAFFAAVVAFFVGAFFVAAFFVVTFFAADFLVAAVFRPEPDFFPPPVSLFTVAQARRAASCFDVPRFSYPCSICSAWRFCLSV